MHSTADVRISILLPSNTAKHQIIHSSIKYLKFCNKNFNKSQTWSHSSKFSNPPSAEIPHLIATISHKNPAPCDRRSSNRKKKKSKTQLTRKILINHITRPNEFWHLFSYLFSVNRSDKTEEKKIMNSKIRLMLH